MERLDWLEGNGLLAGGNSIYMVGFCHAIHAHGAPFLSCYLRGSIAGSLCVVCVSVDDTTNEAFSRDPTPRITSAFQEMNDARAIHE